MAFYAELHAHSCWSLREGASKTAEMIEQALALNYSALALTDHDNLYGAMEFAQAAREANAAREAQGEPGLHPITGCELTLADGSHLTVLVETVEGYRNLCRLLTRAYRVHGKDTPLTEQSWLFELSEGLIVLSGCRRGELQLLLEAGERRRALATAAAFRERLGPERFFVELHHHDVYGDTERVRALAALAEEAGLPIVATGNAHYHVRDRHRLHDVLLATRHHRTLDTLREVRRPNSELFLHHPTEMARRFAAYPEAISNTLVIAERCRFDLTKDLPYELPDTTRDEPEGSTSESLLRGICERAFHRKYDVRLVGPQLRADARERLERELQLIARHKLSGFFLVYWKILKLVGEIAQELHGRDPRLPPDERPVGRGRGSSVSSIVCYLIGLSHIDPVKNNLYLGRFLTDELHSIPDIDLDFPRDIRDAALRRVYDYFGEGHAALVAAFPTYRFRSAVIDVGKALGLPQATLAKINKLGGMYANAEGIADEIARIPELRPLLEAPLWQHMVTLAGELADFPRHISQHVGGIVVSAERIDSVVPVEPARMDGRLVCQWDKDSIEDAHFVKIDFLALGMLSAVNECVDMIEQTHGRRVDLGRISHADPAIFATIRAGDTMGLFQIESRAQIQTLPRTLPANIEDLAVQVAIVRPGPIVAGAFHPYMEYRARQARGEPVAIDYGHPELDVLADCLGETLGHVLYQDQVLQVAEAVAGFTPGQADQLRRAMGRKRSAEEMQKLFEPFREGARRRGFCDEAIQVAYDKFKGFASFGFPRGHAYAFALLAYESAWLRNRFPVEYYCALFNNQPMGFYSIEVLSGDARRHGIRVLPPSINHSRARTWPEQGDMRLGLMQVRGLNANWRQAHQGLPAWRIVREREAHGPYRSLHELLTRARLKPETAEALIRAGALDELGLPRRELLWQLGLLVPPRISGRPRAPQAVQPSLPLPNGQDMVDLPELSPWRQNAWSMEMTGVAPQHPMAMVRPLLHEGIITSQHVGGINNRARLPQGMRVTIAGMVVTRQRPSTAKGVVFLLLEDEFGLANVIVYPDIYDRQRELVRATPFVLVEGTIENERSGMPNIIATRLRPCPLPAGITAPPSHDFG